MDQKQSRKKTKPDRNFDTKLIAYCAMAGGALAVAAPAGAAIIYSGIKNLSVGAGNWSVPIDFDNDSSAECRMSFFSSNWTSSTYKSFSMYCNSGAVLGQTFGHNALKLNKGDSISKLLSPWSGWKKLAGFWRSSFRTTNRNYYSCTLSDSSSTYQGTCTSTTYPQRSSSGFSGNFVGNKGFIGVRFPKDSGTHYGWIQFEADSSVTNGLVLDWAYESTDNASIAAGDNGSLQTTTTTTAVSTTTTSIEGVSTTTTVAPTTTTSISDASCTVTLKPGKISRLLSMLKPVAGFLIQTEDEVSFSRDTQIGWGTEGVKTLLKLPLGKKALLAVVLLRPAQLSPGEAFEVTVGDCTGELSVKQF